MTTTIPPLTGRGMFYGADGGNGRIRQFSESQWTAQCAQAAAWGMQYVHPKVADRIGTWYNEAEMTMLRDVAHAHGLICLPYYYVVVANLARQIPIATQIGSIFHGLILDMEDEWFRQPTAAAQFGQLLRKQFSGFVAPTLYADPQVISQFPYTETLRWCNAWLPMVYYDVWRTHGHPMTAKDAADWLHPQWSALNTHLHSQGINPPPICPLIAVDSALLSAHEVSEWIRGWENILGYCGFWYDEKYAPYADAVRAMPIPSWGHLASQPTQQVPVPPPVRTSTPPPPVVVAARPEPPVPFLPSTSIPANFFFGSATSGLAQHLSEAELLALWHRHNAGIPWDPTHAIIRVWIEAVQFFLDMGMGCPVSNEIHSDVDGQPMQTIAFDSGHTITYFQSSGRIVILGGTYERPESAVAPATSPSVVEPVTPVPVTAAA